MADGARLAELARWLEAVGVRPGAIEGPAVDTVALLPTDFTAGVEREFRERAYLSPAHLRPPRTSKTLLYACSTFGSRRYRTTLLNALDLLFVKEEHLHVIFYQPMGMHCIPSRGSPSFRELSALATKHNASAHLFTEEAKS